MKKKIIIISLLIILTILIITVIYKINNPTERLQKVYQKMINESEYTFTRSTTNKTNEIIMARKGDNMIIDMYNHNENERISTLITKEQTYLIFHNKEEYSVFSVIEEDKNILTDELKNILNLKYSVGKEKVNGTNYYYEEYKGVSYFLNYIDINIDEDTLITRFYFDGKNLKYIKTIYNTISDENGKKEQIEELLKVDLEYKVDDEIFKIPSNYAENVNSQF